MSSPRVCILDAGPLIHLDQLGGLALLCEMGKLFCPSVVAAEAEYHRPGVIGRCAGIHVVDAPSVPQDLKASVVNLHACELAALAWAEKFGADVFVCDDAAARSAADTMGLKVSGTLGVIQHAAETGTISLEEARRILTAIPVKSTLHVKRRLLDAVIASLR